MPFVETSRLLTYYEQTGSGPRLLYINGSGGDLRVKPNLHSGFARHFELLAYDQRGLGQTPAPPGAATMADYADDAAALLDAIGWDTCRVLGLSFGGMVAQELALRHPDRVERLVLACTSSGGAGGASYPLHEWADLPLEERARRTVQISDIRTVALAQDHPDQFAAQVKDWLARAAVGADEPGRAEGLALQMQARRGHDTYDRLPNLNMPVLICGGRFDALARPENQQALHAAIPGSQLEMFDGGHLFLAQDHRAFPTVVAFLSEGGGGSDDYFGLATPR